MTKENINGHRSSAELVKTLLDEDRPVNSMELVEQITRISHDSWVSMEYVDLPEEKTTSVEYGPIFGTGNKGQNNDVEITPYQQMVRDVGNA